MTDLTGRQRDVLRTVLAHQLDHGSPPSLNRIALTLGLSSHSAADQVVAALANKGYLAYSPGRRGGCRLAGVEWRPVFDSTTRAGLVLAELYRDIKGTARTPYLVDAGVLS